MMKGCDGDLNNDRTVKCFPLDLLLSMYFYLKFAMS